MQELLGLPEAPSFARPRRPVLRQVRSNIRRAEAADIGQIERLVADAYGPYVARIGARPLPMDDDYAARIARGEAWVTGNIDGLLVLIPATGYLLIDNAAVRQTSRAGGSDAS